jgi:polysaccharide biosynthesis transport protein
MSVPERLGALNDGDGLGGGLMVLRRRWLMIAGIVAACVLVGVIAHERAAKTYKATATVAFQNTTLPAAALQVNQGGEGEPQRAADTEVLIAHSGRVAEAVRREVGGRPSIHELLKEVTVEAAPNADVLNIVAATNGPRSAARLANAFANQYIAFRAQAQLAGIELAERKLQEQIAALPVRSSARLPLEQSQQRLAGTRALAGGGANIIGAATPPGNASGIGLLGTVGIAIVVGLAIALSLVFLLEALDRRVKTIEEFERTYGLPALAGVSQSAFASVRAEDRSAHLEPYRILRNALEFAAVGRSLDSLLVTSAVSSEGKTTVAVDLAHAIALTGRRVILLELDLRRPTFVSQFGLGAREGFTTALVRGEGASHLLVRPLPGLPNLSALPAGQLPPNPSELLSSPLVTEILSELKSEGGTLVIDAPPLNPVSDTQILLNNPLIDGVLMVARVDLTTRDEVRRARAILDRHTVKPVGIVVTGLRDARRYGYEPYHPPGEAPSGSPARALPDVASGMRSARAQPID